MVAIETIEANVIPATIRDWSLLAALEAFLSAWTSSALSNFSLYSLR